MSGYTRVPNDVFTLAPHLTEAELRVLLYIYRRTIGWNKDTEWISLSQFQDGTGLSSKTHIVEALKRLEKRQLIRATRSTTKTTKYQLVPEADKQLVPLPDKRLVPPVRQALVPPAHPLKDKEIKEWEEAKVRLATSMSKANYTTYIRDLQVLELTDTHLTLSAPNSQVAQWVGDRFAPLIRKALGRPVTVEVQVIRGDSQALMG